MIQDTGLKIIRENTSENLIFSKKFDIIYIEYRKGEIKMNDFDFMQVEDIYMEEIDIESLDE